jgi:tetratricopeptide (TPR) repeat protein
MLTSDAPVINSLSSYLRNQGFKFVLIATCSETDPDGPIHERFQDLFDQLRVICPADITRDEARSLVSELSRTGTKVEIEEPFDGNPRSILLAVNNMRNIKYVRLSQPAKQILRTVKLLRSAGIREYTFSRLIGAATSMSGFNAAQWDEAYSELRTAGFLRSSISTLGPTPEQRYEPVADVYLDVAVPDYGDDEHPPSRDWPALASSFERAKDIVGLTRLGQTCLSSGLIDQSVSSLRSALALSNASSQSLEWATISFNLGLARTLQIERLPETAPLPSIEELEDVEEYFDNALQVFTQTNDPLSWAAAQKGLSDILYRKASQTTRTRERIKALDEASAAYNDAVKVLTPETTPQEWAETQFNYGLILHLQAGMQTEMPARVRRTLYDRSIEALDGALAKLDRKKSAFTWFRAQRKLGTVCVERALSARGTNKVRLLKHAETATREATKFPPPEISMRDLGDTFMELGQTLNTLAAISARSDGADCYLQAAEAFRNALSRYQVGQVSPGQFASERVQALCALAQADSDYLESLGRVGAAGTRTEAITSFEEALRSYPQNEGHEIRVALAEQYLRRSYELPGPTGSKACEDIHHAQELITHALKYVATQRNAALSKRAKNAQQECAERATALNCGSHQGQ